ncbi:MAG TPA: ATP phosphoribosyltransferase regulatory subunit, partial [Herpetosiphonaceae bacterium]
MTPVSIPDPVRGTRDLPPEQLRRQQAVAGRLGDVLDQAGYDQIDLPLLEHRDLYLKKSGDELLGKLYHWTQGGRELALRPEWTASVLRMVNSQGDPPLPLRLRYAGPVFRYERPRRATYRQFTQVGVELIGAAGPRADAEIMGLAVQGLRAVGVEDWTLTIGQIGIIKRLLRALGLAERTTSALTWSLERIRSHGLAAVRDQFDAELDELPIDLAALSHLDDADIETLLLRVLPSLGIRLDGGGRDPAEIVNRLVRKLRRSESPAQLERAWQALEALSGASGPPAEVLPVMRALLREHGIEAEALDELAATLEMLRSFEVDLSRVRLDFGMGRGLHYYTGLIFEIDGTDGLQLCGGGRYDDLVAALGGRPTPAVG